MNDFIAKNQIIVGLVLAALVVGLFVYFGNNSGNLGFLDRQIELSKNHNYLFSDDFDPNKVSVYGISIGDSESKIDESVISEQKNSAGWIHTENDVGYRVSNGEVIEIVLGWDETKRMGLLREDEILIRFGEPDKIEEGLGFSSDGKNYLYIDRGIIVRYSDLGMHINILGK